MCFPLFKKLYGATLSESKLAFSTCYFGMLGLATVDALVFLDFLVL